jgi:hypothetical protein
MPTPSSASAPSPIPTITPLVERHALCHACVRAYSATRTPATAPRTSPTTGIRKKPAIPAAAPIASVLVGAPPALPRRCGSTTLSATPATSRTEIAENAIHPARENPASSP